MQYTEADEYSIGVMNNEYSFIHEDDTGRLHIIFPLTKDTSCPGPVLLDDEIFKNIESTLKGQHQYLNKTERKIVAIGEEKLHGVFF